MVVVGMAVGWWVDHSATYKLAEAYRSELETAKTGEQVFLQGSRNRRRDLEALKAVMRYEHSGKSAAAEEELIWSKSETKLAFDFDIPLADKKGMKFAWDGRPRPADGEIPSYLKPAFNCLGVVLVSDRGHIPIRIGLMTIHGSIPRNLAGSRACAIRDATPNDTARIILPDLLRSILGHSRNVKWPHLRNCGWNKSLQSEELATRTI